MIMTKHMFYIIFKTFTMLYYHCRSLGNVVGAIDWHSFGQLIIRPYGKCCTELSLGLP